jgi:prophage maintenance system killer protein
VQPAKGTPGAAQPISYDEARRIIAQLRVKFAESTNFGVEKDESLPGSLAAVFQAFGGKDVYPTVEGKAAHLLYFLVKNHSFVDGNKRIGAALFLWFLEKNRLLRREDGDKRVADATLVALTLMIAESRPREKDVLCRISEHLLS